MNGKNSWIEVDLGETTVSTNKQIRLIAQVLPFLKVKPGEKIKFVLVDNTRVVIEKVDT